MAASIRIASPVTLKKCMCVKNVNTPRRAGVSLHRYGINFLSVSSSYGCSLYDINPACPASASVTSAYCTEGAWASPRDITLSGGLVSVTHTGGFELKLLDCIICVFFPFLCYTIHFTGLQHQFPVGLCLFFSFTIFLLHFFRKWMLQTFKNKIFQILSI